MSDQSQRRKRIVIETARARSDNGRPPGRQAPAGSREGVMAVTLIAAAALATFVALFLTSRTYDPMNSTLAPEQTVPTASLSTTPSPRPSAINSPSPVSGKVATPTPSTESANEGFSPDDAGIQAQIERTLAADPVLSKLDVSTLVESGKVKIVGSVGSNDLKQRVEKVLRSITGVVSVDDQLVVTNATP